MMLVASGRMYAWLPTRPGWLPIWSVFLDFQPGIIPSPTIPRMVTHHPGFSQPRPVAGEQLPGGLELRLEESAALPQLQQTWRSNRDE